MWECQVSYLDNPTKIEVLLKYFPLEENKRTPHRIISQHNSVLENFLITYTMPK